MLCFEGRWVLPGVGLGPQDLVDCVQLGTQSDEEVGPNEEWGLELRHYAHQVHNLFSPNTHG